MAMKPQRKTLEVFTLSFLDIISCAFGAIVMLVLLAKNGDEAKHRDVSDMAGLLRSIAQAEGLNQQLTSDLGTANDVLQQTQSQNKSANLRQKSLQDTLATAKDKVQQLDSSAEGLSLVIDSQIRAATQVGKAVKRDDEVGGIPVDSEYVIFIVDTSGSMRRIWARLLSEMNNILDTHPKVKGFQVMNDMGTYLMKKNRGGWIQDTPAIRRNVLLIMKGWSSYSNSSPVEGLQVALKTYAKPGASLSIYILGDEYNGGSYDPVIKSLNRLNTDKISGDRIARVHAIGFVSGARTDRFSTLMREVARQNRGTFLALPM
jgi:hypothetical protein